MYLAACRLGARWKLRMLRWLGKATSFERKNGAEDGIRTRDPLLGKEVLYH